MELSSITGRLRPHSPALIGGLPVVALLLIWAVHNGGYDSDTWYWGALVVLAILTAAVAALGPRRRRLPRAGGVALALFALYVAWSYLSIAWAASPGDALQGSNRALLYLLVFTLMVVLPWTPEGLFAAMVTFAIGVGVLAIVLVVRLAADDRVGSLVIDSRLAAPTGYYNATAALFTIGVLVSAGLAIRRELPGPVRGLLIALGCADLQLAMIVQSRGWLFTLPLVAIAALAVSRDRLRLTAAGAIPVAATLAPLHRLLAVYKGSQGAALGHAAAHAGQACLLICGAAFVLATLLAWADSLRGPRRLSPRQSNRIGTVLGIAAVLAVLAAGTAATHGHPIHFVVRQWNGFSTEEKVYSSQSHFADVGSGRYDFWRVSLDAFLAHPIGGLGQDNFADYYISRRHTAEEPAWTHSLEMRLLAHTGIVGFLLFAGFIVAALRLAWRGRRSDHRLGGAIAGTALLPLTVWLIHGSIDWFWEMPALSGPALGFLAAAGSLGATGEHRAAPSRDRDRLRRASAALRAIPRPAALGGGLVALLAGVAVLGFPYLSVREVSTASNLRYSNPQQALRDLSNAADLNPLSADPGRLGGTIALAEGQPAVAAARFRQSLARERGGWFAWLGAGVAASALGQTPVAVRDFEVARSINDRQPAIKVALARARTSHPLTYDQMLPLLVLIQ